MGFRQPDRETPQDTGRAPGVRLGTVTSFGPGSFGFIAPDAGGAEHVVRLRSVECVPVHGLLAGERVEFELAWGTLGLEAVKVRPLDAAGGLSV